MSEEIHIDDLEGPRREAYLAARNERGAKTYVNAEGEPRKVRYTRPLTSGNTMEGLDDVTGHHMPGYWYDAPGEGGPGTRFTDKETT
jgi:hypothetical protein